MNELDESGTVYLFESAVNCSGKTKTFEAPRNFIQVWFILFANIIGKSVQFQQKRKKTTKPCLFYYLFLSNNININLEEEMIRSL